MEISEDKPVIGTLNEGSLHSAMKILYTKAGDQLEVPIDGYVVDIWRNTQKENVIIEIQTSSFGSMRKKLESLLQNYEIKVVYPIAIETHLRKPSNKVRKSPKKGSIYTIFNELVSITELLQEPNLSFDAVLTTVTKIQEYDPKLRRNRGGYRTVNTELKEILSTQHFDGITDFMQLLPSDLPKVFTTADIAASARVPRQIAQQMAYCFRKTNVIEEIGSTRRGKEYKYL